MRISTPAVSNGQITVVCEAIGHPTVVVEWLDSVSNNLALSTSEKGNPFERSITGTLTVNQRDCQDPYTCVVRNMDATLRMTRQVSFCDCKCLSVVVAKCVCVCVCV